MLRQSGQLALRILGSARVAVRRACCTPSHVAPSFRPSSPLTCDALCSTLQASQASRGFAAQVCILVMCSALTGASFHRNVPWLPSPPLRGSTVRPSCWRFVPLTFAHPGLARAARHQR